MQIQVLQKDELSTLKELISGYTGFTFTASREHTLVQALSAFSKVHNCTSLLQFEHMLRTSDALMKKFTESLLIHETYFFREKDSLAQLISLLEKKNDGNNTGASVARIWSAGCSTGEEPYSLALLLLESAFKANFRIVGTDISQQAINHAGNAHYSEWSLRSLNSAQREKYFERGLKTYRLKDETAKQRVTFVKANLTEENQLSREWSNLDAIICRNVLIYFEQQAISKIAKIFFHQLKPGGILLTGASDPPLIGCADFEVEYTATGIVYRKPELQIYKAARRSQAATPMKSRKSINKPVVVTLNSTAQTNAASAGHAKTTFEKAMQLYRTGQWQDVVKLLAPQPSISRSLLIRSLLNLGRTEEATILAEAACQNEPLDATNHLLLALVMMSEQRQKDAAAIIKKALFLDRNYIVAHFLLGISCFCTGDRNQALKSMKNAQNLLNALPAGAAIPLAEEESREQFQANVQRYLTII